jgi:hypothetical protein
MEIRKIQELLSSTENINFSKHSYEKMQIRKISEEEVRNNLKNPTKLISFEDQGEDLHGHKYTLLFSKSHKYDLRIIVSIKDKNINVITAHVQNIKRRKVLEKWLKRQK